MLHKPWVLCLSTGRVYVNDTGGSGTRPPPGLLVLLHLGFRDRLRATHLHPSPFPPAAPIHPQPTSPAHALSTGEASLTNSPHCWEEQRGFPEVSHSHPLLPGTQEAWSLSHTMPTVGVTRENRRWKTAVLSQKQHQELLLPSCNSVTATGDLAGSQHSLQHRLGAADGAASSRGPPQEQQPWAAVVGGC